MQLSVHARVCTHANNETKEGGAEGRQFWTNGAEQQGRRKELSDVNNLEVAVSWTSECRETEWQTDGRREEEKESGAKKK